MDKEEQTNSCIEEIVNECRSQHRIDFNDISLCFGVSKPEPTKDKTLFKKKDCVRLCFGQPTGRKFWFKCDVCDAERIVRYMNACIEKIRRVDEPKNI